ncbi:MAG TPA: hypothetical protein VFX20_17995 [Steroidobacteraceae bacterium]|nr:hypothetical protein [Steroidobacteraceae bacterium]
MTSRDSQSCHRPKETVVLGDSPKDARFLPHPGKPINGWLRIRHGRGIGAGTTVTMTYRKDTLIILSMDDAKRLRAWLDAVIP